jgi:Uma2 family endonuclease
MSTVSTAILHTPEDLLAMPDGDHYELVNGKLVERNMGAYSSYVATRLVVILDAFCQANRLGWVFSEGTSYQCFPDNPDKVRRADVSFIRLGRLPGEQPPEGHIRICPDLAAEVVSPNDLAYEIDGKVEEYLAAGVPLVWVVNPQTRTVRVHRAGRPGANLRADDELTGDDVLPGFRCRITELFQPAAGTAPGSRGA